VVVRVLDESLFGLLQRHAADQLVGCDSSMETTNSTPGSFHSAKKLGGIIHHASSNLVMHLLYLPKPHKERTPPQTEASDLQDPFVRMLDVCSTIAAARITIGTSHAWRLDL